MNNLLNCSLLNFSLLNGSLQRPNHNLNIFTSVSLLSTYFQNFSGAADHQRWGNGGLYKKNMLAQLGADQFPNTADQNINNSLHYKISIKLFQLFSKFDFVHVFIDVKWCELRFPEIFLPQVDIFPTRNGPKVLKFYNKLKK